LLNSLNHKSRKELEYLISVLLRESANTFLMVTSFSKVAT
jgi:hypothetical protein